MAAAQLPYDSLPDVPRFTLTSNDVAVHALSDEQVGVDNSVGNAIAGFNMFGKVLARAILTPVYEQ